MKTFLIEREIPGASELTDEQLRGITVAGHTPLAVAEHLAAHRVNVWNGHNYAWELTAALGIRDAGSAVRAGLVHYNDAQDVERLLSALEQL